ncbi:hypothetical protein EQG79_01520 [Spirosoma sordidisoli]|uniref:AntA/AntB antirepressor domain-containing protein n=1 Tax=Spirosoma sordidisoli TaxID=2502893 RepID=A0A4V1RWN2_9BACT|nr:hypothetical protein EQG79_01520 [Spirosoma sordidisoli]
MYSFLEVKSRFNDWIKNRIIKYGFIEDTDYVTLTKTLVSGGVETDYALTLDMAKELSMVERNAKGKEARQYFIEAEKIARQLIEQQAPAPALSNEQLILQLMAGQQEILSQLRADIESIKAGQRPPARVLPGLPGRQLSLPGVSARRRPENFRSMISRKVADYSATCGATTQQTYNYLYKRLYHIYGIDVYQLFRGERESILDALEKYGHLERLYGLIMAELNIPDDL